MRRLRWSPPMSPRLTSPDHDEAEFARFLHQAEVRVHPLAEILFEIGRLKFHARDKRGDHVQQLDGEGENGIDSGLGVIAIALGGGTSDGVGAAIHRQDRCRHRSATPSGRWHRADDRQNSRRDGFHPLTTRCLCHLVAQQMCDAGANAAQMFARISARNVHASAVKIKNWIEIRSSSRGNGGQSVSDWSVSAVAARDRSLAPARIRRGSADYRLRRSRRGFTFLAADFPSDVVA